ncbi:hypothetical protein SAMN04489730_6089 [Amycolatopsis australiensis]|uniref:Uncharacterized protein n=1 Tax=Amycolatopsis australiensis TaxID=546364 RepID=A0A1K1SLW1_9PSEU|nr:hypothetical protein SAMN04489730_6089 [Amycolatopsis australiensis]
MRGLRKVWDVVVAGLARAAWFPAPIWPAGPKSRWPGESR